MRNTRLTSLAFAVLLPALLATGSVFATDSAVGRWKTIDDDTGKPKSIVEITQAANGSVSGRIVELINREVVLENVLKSILAQGMKLFPQAQKAVFLKFDHETQRTEVINVSGYDPDPFNGMSPSSSCSARSE